MGFKLDEIYNGFKLIKEEEVKEINSMCRVFEHVKTGAKLMSLLNDDDNKVFSISFRTPPEDSTGLPHILEHSVLCGSRKFPTKEPFVELLKGSLNTFLNAMTFSDKTMYPVASRNHKDFINLMDVYMDAVLYPNIHSIPEILMQEGWHYHIEKPEDPITYKGVVYNEMKGAFSSPEGVLYRKIQESLLKDTIYGNESGGDPKNITDLTKEQFETFHKRYYHPSNSYIFIYGDGDLHQQMKFINEEYLDGFDKIDIDSHIEKQIPYENMETVEMNYSISQEDDEKDKTFMSLNYVVGESTDREMVLAMDILEYMLLENPAAPLKKALVDAKIGKDVYGSYDSSIIQPTLSVILKNTNKDKIEEFKSIVYNTLGNIVENGLDKELIEASINIKEFNLREAEMGGLSKGILYSIQCMDSWLYDSDAFMHLKYEEALKSIKEKAENGYFEKLIKENILENKHSSLVILNPEKGLGDRENKELEDKLKAFKDGLSKEEIDKLVQDTQRLLKRQTTPDTKEDLDKIPLLEIADIPAEPEFIESIEKEIEGIKTLHQNIFTGKILYLSMYFDATVVPQEDAKYAALLGAILGKVNTENKEYTKLSNDININTGGINFKLQSFSDGYDDTIYYPKFAMKTKVLTDKIPSMLELVREIMFESKFDDHNRLHDILKQVKSRIESGIISRGHSVVINRVNSYYSPAAKYSEDTTGITYFKFISDLEKNFEANKETLAAKLKECALKLFNQHGLIINATCEDEEYNLLKDNFKTIQKSFSRDRLSQQEYKFEETRENEGLKTPGNVQFVGKGYNYKRLGMDYSGKLQVLKKIAGMDYLWNKVRVQGGAYGCVMSLTKAGNLAIGSYRDPNIKETLDAYNGIFNYMHQMDIDEREQRKYIIGTISDMDSPLSSVRKGERAFADHLKGLTYADYKKERQEILDTKQKDIKELSAIFKDVMRKDFLCVMGNENKIDENKDLFNKFMNVFE